MEDVQAKELQNLIIYLREKITEKDKVIDDLVKKISEMRDIFKYITEKDELVYNSKKELEMIFDASDDYIVVLDKCHNIRRANALFCKLVNKEPREVIGTKFTDYFDTRDIDFEKINIPQDKFLETIIYSKIFQKAFVVKSRRLQKNLEPLVYIHITSEILGNREC